MAQCYITIKGEVINPKRSQLDSGTIITEFAIKVDTNDYKTKEWTTSFLNGKLIGDYDLETKKIYEFKGKLESNVFTKKDGEEINRIILTAFEIVEGGNEKRTQNKVEEQEESEITSDELPF